ncbi:MAG: ABC transporter permease [Lachnospiraceae bacterium]|nr:ABC transporter permease [Lachnospiraceae bacterium]MCI8996539.1 ABC transporter permease [Lachnospiraceae bacterium]MCI9134334.1 ABC transporter permease [Lachnospiraceae bacterium]
MLRYIGKRILLAIPTLLIVAVISFAMIRMIPGGPAVNYLGITATPETVAEINARLGLDRSIAEQFLEFLKGICTGDFGTSFVYNRPVMSLILEKLPVTLQLTGCAVLVSILMGIPLGLAAAMKRGSWMDQGITALAVCGVAIPEFWLSLMLVQFISLPVAWFPTGGYAAMGEGFLPWLRHILLPAITLGFIFSAVMCRMTRSAMIDVLSQDYIKTARAKGQKEWIVMMLHAFRNAMIPVITVVGISICSLIGGAVVVEQIYSIPGIGRLFINAIMDRDYPLFQGLVFYLGAFVVVVNLLVDMICVLLNPKISLGDHS